MLFRDIASNLDINIKPTFLRLYYFNIFKKYQAIKKGSPEASQWPLYEIFDNLYSKRNTDPENSCDIIEYTTSPINEIEFDDVEEKMDSSVDALQFIAENFNEICKLCLNLKDDLVQLKDDPESVEKINLLFFTSVSLRIFGLSSFFLQIFHYFSLMKN